MRENTIIIWKKVLAVVLVMILAQTMLVQYCFAEDSVSVSTANAGATLKISKTKVTLYIGQKITLKVNGAKKIKWKSSNESVATVSSKGKVTAKQAGSATITAKVNGKKYKCKVTVKSAYEIEKSEMTVYVDHEATIAIKSPYSKKIQISGDNQFISSSWVSDESGKKGEISIVGKTPGTETIIVSNSKTSETAKIVITVEQEPYSLRIRRYILGYTSAYHTELDVNRDGEINTKDYVLASKIENAYADPNQKNYSDRIRECILNGEYDKSLDINNDGKITSLDYVIAKKVQLRMYS